MMKKNDSVTLVTGSNGGIGIELVEYLLKNDYRNVICHYKNKDSDIRKILNKYDVDPSRHLFQADLTNEEEVKNLHAAIIQKFNRVDHLINIAGGSSNCISWKLSVDEFRRVIDMNLLSTFLMCREFSTLMRTHGYGRIINLSSVVALSGVSGASHYCAAKAAIIGYSKSLARELANKNITVNVVALGYFNTGLIHDVPSDWQEEIKKSIPLNRFGKVSELGGLVNYLLSEEGAYSTGNIHHLNGGLF